MKLDLMCLEGKYELIHYPFGEQWNDETMGTEFTMALPEEGSTSLVGATIFPGWQVTRPKEPLPEIWMHALVWMQGD